MTQMACGLLTMLEVCQHSGLGPSHWPHYSRKENYRLLAQEKSKLTYM